MRLLAICLAASLVLAPSARAQQASVTAVPDYVFDGDTLRLAGVRVRLWGVDAPEMSTALGPPARAHLVEILGRGAVRCVGTGQWSYERAVARCYDARGEDIAARMVRDGWAVDWRTYSRGAYAGLQASAQRGRAGAFAYGVRPWR